MNSNKMLNALLLIFVFIIGMCVGVLCANDLLYPSAYPGSGDWNGDGVVNVLDLFAAIKDLIYGAELPEIVYG